VVLCPSGTHHQLIHLIPNRFSNLSLSLFSVSFYRERPDSSQRPRRVRSDFDLVLLRDGLPL
jgi:hypothetical protein